MQQKDDEFGFEAYFSRSKVSKTTSSVVTSLTAPGTDENAGGNGLTPQEDEFGFGAYLRTRPKKSVTASSEVKSLAAPGMDENAGEYGTTPQLQHNTVHSNSEEKPWSTTIYIGAAAMQASMEDVVRLQELLAKVQVFVNALFLFLHEPSPFEYKQQKSCLLSFLHGTGFLVTASPMGSDLKKALSDAATDLKKTFPVCFASFPSTLNPVDVAAHLIQAIWKNLDFFNKLDQLTLGQMQSFICRINTQIIEKFLPIFTSNDILAYRIDIARLTVNLFAMPEIITSSAEDSDTLLNGALWDDSSVVLRLDIYRKLDALIKNPYILSMLNNFIVKLCTIWGQDKNIERNSFASSIALLIGPLLSSLYLLKYSKEPFFTDVFKALQRSDTQVLSQNMMQSFTGGYGFKKWLEMLASGTMRQGEPLDIDGDLSADLLLRVAKKVLFKKEECSQWENQDPLTSDDLSGPIARSALEDNLFLQQVKAEDRSLKKFCDSSPITPFVSMVHILLQSIGNALCNSPDLHLVKDTTAAIPKPCFLPRASDIPSLNFEPVSEVKVVNNNAQVAKAQSSKLN